jgi:TusA-related sulfurtransferase
MDSFRTDAVIEGGDLDCGSGLLLILRNALEPLPVGAVLQLKSREISVKEDLPAWCRMVGHELVAVSPGVGREANYFLRKGARDATLAQDVEAARAFQWKVRAAWGGALRTRVYARNHSFDVGQPASFETSDAAPAAVEVLLGALGGCLVSGYAWRLSRRGIELRAAEVTLSARLKNVLVFLGVESGDHPGLERVQGVLYVAASATGEELEGLWRETCERSPVAQSLLRGAPLEIEMRRVD